MFHVLLPLTLLPAVGLYPMPPAGILSLRLHLFSPFLRIGIIVGRLCVLFLYFVTLPWPTRVLGSSSALSSKLLFFSCVLQSVRDFSINRG